MKQTGQATDVALSGPGFLAVMASGTERYVRGGSLLQRGDGRMVTLEGYEVLDKGGSPISVPPGAQPSIGQDGSVMINGNPIAQLKLVEFASPKAVSRQGNGVYAASPAGPAPTPATSTQVVAGTLEGANVSPIQAMTEVISTSRHYEALHRVIEAFKEIDTAAAHDLATVS
jgi:flagellar basal body rod protein FlgG